MRWTAAVLLLRCVPAPPATAGDAGSGCGGLGEAAARPCRAGARATVERIVDGDTLDVAVDGSGPSRVRLIGIDAPEHDEGLCGSGAAGHLASLAPAGTRLVLEFDGECRDAYGRDLAYAWAHGRMLNAAMLSDGYAQACPFEPNTAHAAEFRCLEEEAGAAGTELWALGCHRDECFR